MDSHSRCVSCKRQDFLSKWKDGLGYCSYCLEHHHGISPPILEIKEDSISAMYQPSTGDLENFKDLYIQIPKNEQQSPRIDGMNEKKFVKKWVRGEIKIVSRPSSPAKRERFNSEGEWDNIGVTEFNRAPLQPSEDEQD